MVRSGRSRPPGDWLDSWAQPAAGLGTIDPKAAASAVGGGRAGQGWCRDSTTGRKDESAGIIGRSSPTDVLARPAVGPRVPTYGGIDLELVLVDTRSGRRRTVALGPDPQTLGSGIECDVIVPSPEVAERACTVRASGEGIVLEAVGSASFTLNE